MSGNNYNKGQVLLITVMLLATALTIALSVAFTSKTETQITKLEEESQKALAAAEAGIEALLKSSSNTIDISSLGIGFSGTATVERNPGPFISPLIRKDEQYTLYVADYDNTLTNPYIGNLTISYGTESDCSQIALELTAISSTYTLTRWIADTGKILSDDVGVGLASPSTIEGVEFSCQAAINLNNALVVMVRTFGDDTKIGVGSSTFKPQGKTIPSSATSSTGITKRVELFQSYPQIPSEMFVTSL
jgi:hypothetical protein